MTTRWNDLVALAREIEQARREGKTMDPRKARRLARAVLELEHAPLNHSALAGHTHCTR